MIVQLGLNVVGILELSRTFLVVYELIVNISVFKVSRLVSSIVCRLGCVSNVFVVKNGDRFIRSVHKVVVLVASNADI